MHNPEKVTTKSEKTPEQLATRDLLAAQKHDIEQKKLAMPADHSAKTAGETPTAQDFEQARELKQQEIARKNEEQRRKEAKESGQKPEDVPTLEESIREQAMTLRKNDVARELKIIEEKWWLDRDHPVFRQGRKLFDLVLDPLKAALKYPFKSYFADPEREKLAEKLSANQQKLLQDIFQANFGNKAEYEQAAKEQWAKLRAYDSWQEYRSGVSLDQIRRKNKRNLNAVKLTEDLDEYDVREKLHKAERRDFERQLELVYKSLSAAVKA